MSVTLVGPTKKQETVRLRQTDTDKLETKVEPQVETGFIPNGCSVPVCLFSFLNQLIFTTHTHTHARTHARTNARTHARTRARTHARTHTHTHSHARTHIRTHTHTRTLTH